MDAGSGPSRAADTTRRRMVISCSGTNGVIRKTARSGTSGDEFAREYGQARADWMMGVSRNLCLYPNVYLMDQFGSQIRHYRPISVDKTEVTIYCIAPKGESADARTARIRQYEDFFNASGMATPDDLEEFRSCQKTYLATAAPWNDMSRGAEHWIDGPDDDAKALGLDPEIERGQDRGRGPIPRPARLLEEGAAEGLESRRRERGAGRPPAGPLSADPSARSCTFPGGHNGYFGERGRAVPLSRGALPRRPRVQQVARVLCARSEFWMPAWVDATPSSPTPQNEISLIYYNDRGGLEDRVFRMKTERSSATSLPEPRTRHNIWNVEILEPERSLRTPVQLAYDYFRYKAVDPYFGTSFYTLDLSDRQPHIKKKKVILKNDYIHHVVDIYHV